MLVIISPAKSLNLDPQQQTEKYSIPEFIEESEYLVKKLKKLSPQKIGNLMNISPDLADLNHQRFADWSTPFTPNNAKQSLLSFSGDVYRGINTQDFSESDLQFAQDHLRILSGMYGLLRPLDLMQPYRLEMGTKFKVTPKLKNLYKFWDGKITEVLNELSGDVLINLASNEYFKAVHSKSFKGRVVTPQFKDWKNGEYKTIMTFAKLARGYMTRYIIKNRITKAEDLLGFDENAYVYNPKLSTEDQPVFTRDKQ